MAAKEPRDGMNGRDGRDVFPRPDPTRLTSDLVDSAVASLREVLEAKIDGQKSVFEARFSGNERAVTLLQTIMDRQPAEVDVKVGHLQGLHDEKFKTVMVEFVSVQTQFSERDVRGRDAALANTTAVNAALQAQKEAAGEQAKSFTLSIDKSEKGTLEQIAQQRVLLETMKQTLDGKVEDVKERLTRIESIAVGMTASKTEITATHTASNQNIGVIVGLVGMGIAVVALIERFAR